MDRNDDDIDFVDETRPHQKRRFRWAIRAVFVMCGTAMAIIILSEPAVRHRVQGGTAWLSGLVTPGEDVAMMDNAVATSLPANADPAPATAPVPVQAPVQARAPVQPQERIIPQVSAMPTSRIPVRRGSQSAGN